jgi:hypothetical protein
LYGSGSCMVVWFRHVCTSTVKLEYKCTYTFFTAVVFIFNLEQTIQSDRILNTRRAFASS